MRADRQAAFNVPAAHHDGSDLEIKAENAWQRRVGCRRKARLAPQGLPSIEAVPADNDLIEAGRSGDTQPLLAKSEWKNHWLSVQ
jgi:hypothetical protein